ncbi:MAG TPA: hypothetical protein VK400_11660 [Pyrinomonadaceae bacterium]|nr:hypothetical protein [Pyrinomonadaceae bacterium]
MADDKDKTAYIGIERGEKSLKYIAKVFDEPPREITKQQYNAIVKALSAQDWKSGEAADESSLISKIISSQIKPPA